MKDDKDFKIHVHHRLIDKLSNMSAAIKIHKMVADEGHPLKISKARDQLPLPSYQEIANLLDTAVREMQQCTKPVKK